MNALASISPAQTTEIAAIVDRARLALDEGDVQAAMLLSGGAYAESKAAAGYAEKVKASRQLIEKFRRLQADALKVESYATIRLSEIVDEGQTKGEIAKPGRKANILGGNISTLDDFGLNAKQLHEARTLAKAERKSPGFVERATEAFVEAGFEATRTALKKAASHAIGTKSASKEERGVDLYETPLEATRTLLALESFRLNVLEPSVGKGAILRPLEAAGYDVTIADFMDRGITTQHGEVQGVGDFLAARADADFAAGTRCGPDIVTNPPYGIANAYIAHALREFRPGKMAMLLNLNFLAGFEDPDRLFVMDECPPSRIYVFTRRLPMMHRDGWEGDKASSQMNTAWFVWERELGGTRYGNGYPQIIRVDWQQFQNAEPLAPGEGGNISPLTFVEREAEEDFTRSKPRKSEEQRVEEEFERAILFIRNMEPFGLRKFCSNVAVRTLVGEALIDALLFNDLIQPAGDGEWVITPKGISLAIDVSAVAMTREWRAAREAKRGQGGGE